MKKYRKPHSVLVTLESEDILDFGVSGGGNGDDALSKRQNIIIDDAESYSEDVSSAKDGLESEW